MKRLKLNFMGMLFVSLLSLFVVVGNAHADILTMDLDTEYSGGSIPTGSVRATFVDTGPNSVRLTMDATDLIGMEFVSKMNFNFDPDLDVSLLVFHHNLGTDADKIVQKLDSIKAAGGGKYDISFIFPVQNATGDRFGAGETSVYDIQYNGPDTMDVTSFGFISAEHGGNGMFYSSAHIQGISDSSCPIEYVFCGSGWIGAYEYIVQSDRDRDGVVDAHDNCPDEPNSDQTDGDGDQYGAACDCDDTDSGVNPGIPTDVCDGVDNDCDGDVDEDAEETETVCDDGVDNDCDGLTDYDDVDDCPLTYEIGDTGPAGGIVFYVTDGGSHGLEAAPQDHPAYAPWGCFGTEIAGADGTAIGTGAQNTADILAGCSEAGIAAAIAENYLLNGYDDWFLPSKDELNLLYQQKAVVGGFADDYYWSSAEVSGIEAWAQEFSLGGHNYADKGLGARVRAVRAF